MTLLQRVRAVGGDARLAVGATIGVLMVVIPLLVLAVLVGTGQTGDTGGFVVIAMITLGGVYVLYDVVRKAGLQELREEVVVTDGIYGRTVPLPEPSGPKPRAWKAVVAILVLMVIVPIAFAVVMSELDDHLRGHQFVGFLVVTVAVSLISVLVRVVVARYTTRRR